MGFFRRYKLTDYTAEECRDEMRKREHAALWSSDTSTHNDVACLMDEWACFRELLARHEKDNQSPLDGKSNE